MQGMVHMEVREKNMGLGEYEGIPKPSIESDMLTG
jgi:hypothetical protein